MPSADIYSPHSSGKTTYCDEITNEGKSMSGNSIESTYRRKENELWDIK